MYYDDHDPPHLHVEYQGSKATVDFDGNVLRGGIGSRTALRLIRQWIDLHFDELQEDWALVKSGHSVNKIAPLE